MEALLRDHVLPELPLLVSAVAWTEDQENLNVRGPGWSFNTDAAWRVFDEAGLLFGWDSPNAQGVAELVGARLVHVDVQSDRLALDPALHFDNGWTLEVFSGRQDEPWVLRLPGLTLVAPVV
ncbi:hypothetical protein [Deinococcus pimensis]|uniref:hypothetical protein n=1 Tax=Deinococcus pimensis TaxID=309888 RepID=UPI0012F92A3E|nr:hypothetical protein [Deinococcus pimensis]